MPLNLLFLRHGESEGNVVHDLAKSGNLGPEIAKNFGERHGSTYRLTTRGRNHAKLAGLWIRDNFIPDGFKPEEWIDRVYVSSHVRAIETGGISTSEMGIKDPIIFLNPWESERSWGEFEFFSPTKSAEYAALRKRMKKNPLHIAPPGGESLLNLGIRACYPLYSTLAREYPWGNVLVVCHGEVMWMHRFLLERLTEEEFNSLENSSDPRDKIHNGEIIHYTRISPWTGAIEPYYCAFRLVIPEKPELNSDWKLINRKRFAPSDLLAMASRHSPLLDDSALAA